MALYFADRPVKDYVDGLLIGTQDLDIPAGEPEYWRHIYMDVPAGITMIDIFPHMHDVGSKVLAIASLPDGSTIPLIRIEDWDFRWQNVYVYRKPIHLPKGSRIDAWFAFDNSADNPANPNVPPQSMKWGWQSTEEMAELWITILHDDWSKRDALIKASWGPWMRPAKSTPPPEDLLDKSSAVQ